MCTNILTLILTATGVIKKFSNISELKSHSKQDHKGKNYYFYHYKRMRIKDKFFQWIFFFQRSCVKSKTEHILSQSVSLTQYVVLSVCLSACLPVRSSQLQSCHTTLQLGDALTTAPVRPFFVVVINIFVVGIQFTNSQDVIEESVVNQNSSSIHFHPNYEKSTS